MVFATMYLLVSDGFCHSVLSCVFLTEHQNNSLETDRKVPQSTFVLWIRQHKIKTLSTISNIMQMVKKHLLGNL
jgi:hypothetical protein